MKRMKRRDILRDVVVTAIVLWLVLATLAPGALAAPQQTSTRFVMRQATVLDPFTLRTVALSGTSAGGQPQSPPGLIKNPNPRRAIRIPFRLPVRSPCKPGLD